MFLSPNKHSKSERAISLSNPDRGLSNCQATLADSDVGNKTEEKSTRLQFFHYMNTGHCSFELHNPHILVYAKAHSDLVSKHVDTIV